MPLHAHTFGKTLKLAAALSAFCLLPAAFCSAAQMRSLFSDLTARRVGDSLTIIIVESTQASRSASTKSAKTNGLGFSASFDSVPRGGSASGSGSTSSAYDGSGATQSSGALTTTVTALVSEVLPNGYLKVEGKRTLTINNEKETLTVSGICRVVDIRPDNTVLSQQLANPVISYTGDGWINKQQKPNIFLRVLAGILPFF